jgi:hypothetical protein
LELCADISDVDLNIFLSSIVGVDGYEVSGFNESINNHPNQVKLTAKTSFSVGVSFDIHDSAKQMKDKCSKALVKPQGQ